jgi:hypothetical protein
MAAAIEEDKDARVEEAEEDGLPNPAAAISLPLPYPYRIHPFTSPQGEKDILVSSIR